MRSQIGTPCSMSPSSLRITRTFTSRCRSWGWLQGGRSRGAVQPGRGDCYWVGGGDGQYIKRMGCASDGTGAGKVEGGNTWPSLTTHASTAKCQKQQVSIARMKAGGDSRQHPTLYRCPCLAAHAAGYLLRLRRGRTTCRRCADAGSTNGISWGWEGNLRTGLSSMVLSGNDLIDLLLTRIAPRCLQR